MKKVYAVKGDVIERLKGALNNPNVTSDEFKDIIEQLKDSEIVENYQTKRRKVASRVLDMIVDLHPEFSELPFLAMKHIVDTQISTIISELALYEKRIDNIREQGEDNEPV